MQSWLVLMKRLENIISILKSNNCYIEKLVFLLFEVVLVTKRGFLPISSQLAESATLTKVLSLDQSLNAASPWASFHMLCVWNCESKNWSQ